MKASVYRIPEVGLVASVLVAFLTSGCGGGSGADVPDVYDPDSVADVADLDTIDPDPGQDRGVHVDVGDAGNDARSDAIVDVAPDVAFDVPGDKGPDDAADVAGDADPDSSDPDAVLDSVTTDSFVMPTDPTSCLAAGLCWIDSECHLAGTVDPDRPCWTCQPSVMNLDWTVLSDDSPCDDDDLGTYDDKCTSGDCGGTMLICPVYGGQCEQESHPDGTSNCNYSYPVGRSCNDGNDCTCNDTCNDQGGCGGTLVVCPIVVTPCYPQSHCNGGCGCELDPWPGPETGCSYANGSGHCNGSGVCVLSSCAEGYLESSATTGTCVPQFVRMSAGESHTCALAGNGLSYCWGNNSNGQIGDGSGTDRDSPTQVSNLTNVAGVVAGQNFSCAWTNAGAAYCWGDNTMGQLGNGTTTPSNVPVAVSGLGSGVTKVSAGALFACAIKDSEIWCWGANTKGQIGVDSTADQFLTPQKVGLAGSLDCECGSQHVCSVTFQNNVICWGDNKSGQLGIGDTDNRLKPSRLTDEDSASYLLSLGAQHTCVLRRTNSGANDYLYEIRCWGSDSNGQLAGEGASVCTYGNCSLYPVTVASWIASKEAAMPPAPAAGFFHTCYADSSGVLRCVGHNDYGQLGTNNTVPFVDFQQILSSGVIKVDGGSRHTCAIVNSAPYCWGRNSDGQVGDHSFDDRLTPTRVLW